MDEVLQTDPAAPLVAPKPRKSTSFYIKRTIGSILLLVLAGVFFYSAYSKLGIFIRWSTPANHTSFPISIYQDDNTFDSFQWTFFDLGISSILLTGIIARVMIGLEVLLGLFLVCHIFLKSFTYKAVIAILSIFIVYLIVVILKQGNSGNCGCFGNQLSMTPMQAIWKNIAMIAATLVLWKIYDVKPYKYQEYICLFVAAIALSTPFLLRFMYVGTDPEAPQTATTLNLDPLYRFDPAPTVDLKKGKHIIAFMSLTCPHCKKAAYLLQIIHHEHPDYPIYIVLDGSENFLKPFFNETHAEDVPHLYFHHTPEFMALAGPSVPSILWVNNGTVEYKSTYAYYQLDPKFMAQWFKK
jgi:hypothetical protein